jgi:hypothetical protein
MLEIFSGSPGCLGAIEKNKVDPVEVLISFLF